jgi:hypothetical protein
MAVERWCSMGSVGRVDLPRGSMERFMDQPVTRSTSKKKKMDSFPSKNLAMKKKQKNPKTWSTKMAKFQRGFFVFPVPPFISFW